MKHVCEIREEACYCNKLYFGEVNSYTNIENRVSFFLARIVPDGKI